MPIEVTNTLTPEMQAVADCREAVKKCQLDVEVRKLELKEAKAAWETAVQALNERLDEMLESERQPTLFPRFGKDNLENPPTEAATSATETTATATAGVEVLDAEFTVNPDSVASLPPTPSWRKLAVAEEIDGETETFDALAKHSIETLGQLADALLREETFGLRLVVVDELKDIIQDVSQEDPTPIRFDAGDEEPEEEDPDRTAKWERGIVAVPPLAGLSLEDCVRMEEQIATFREAQKTDTAVPAWNTWSEFDVEIETSEMVVYAVKILYKPGWKGDPNSDHVEAWGPLSETGYFSEELTHIKGKRPTQLLAAWAKEWCQKQREKFEERQVSKKTKTKKLKATDKKKSGAGKPSSASGSKKGAA